MDDVNGVRIIGIQEDKPSAEVISGVVVVDGLLSNKEPHPASGDGSDSGHQSSPEKEGSDDDQALLKSNSPRDDDPERRSIVPPSNMQGISNAAFVADDEGGKTKVETSNGVKGSQKANGEVAQQRLHGASEIFIPEDALLNHHSGQVRVKKKQEKRKKEEEKVPMHELKSVVIPLNGISEKELKEFKAQDDKQQVATTPVDGDKLAKKPLDEYFIPANTHTKFLRREKLYLTKDKNSLCCGRKRFFVFCAVTVIFAIAVLVGVLAATGILQADSGSERGQTGSQLPHPASMSQSMSPLPTHQLPLTTQHPYIHRRTSQSNTFLSTLTHRPTTTSQQLPIVTPVPTIVPSTIVDGEFTILNKNFSTSLLSNMSEDFQALASELESKLREIFRGKEGLVSVKVLQFKEGSIVVTYITTWSRTEDEESLNSLLEKHLNDHHGYLGHYLIQLPTVVQQANYSSPPSINPTTAPVTNIFDKENRTFNNGYFTTTTVKDDTDHNITTTTKPITMLTIEVRTDATIVTTSEKQFSNTTSSEVLNSDFPHSTSVTTDDTTSTKLEDVTQPNVSTEPSTTVLQGEHPQNITPNTPLTESDAHNETKTHDVTSEAVTETEKPFTRNEEATTKLDTIVTERTDQPDVDIRQTTNSTIDSTTEALQTTTQTLPETELVTEGTVTPTTTTSTENRQATNIQENETSIPTEASENFNLTSTQFSGQNFSNAIEEETTQPAETEVTTVVEEITKGTPKDFDLTSGNEKSITVSENYALDTTTENFLSFINLTVPEKTKPSANITKRPKVVDYDESYMNDTMVSSSTMLENPTTTIAAEDPITSEVPIKNDASETLVSAFTEPTDISHMNETGILTTESSNENTTELSTKDANPEELPTVTVTTQMPMDVVVNTENSEESIANTTDIEENAKTETNKDLQTETILNEENLTLTTISSEVKTTEVTPDNFNGNETLIPTVATVNVSEDNSNLDYVTQMPNVTNNEDDLTTLISPELASIISKIPEETTTISEGIPEELIFQSNKSELINNTNSENITIADIDENIPPQILLEMNETLIANGSDFSTMGNVTGELEQELNETDIYMVDDYNITSFLDNTPTDSAMMLAEDNTTLSEVDGTTFPDLENESPTLDEQNGTIFHSSDASNGSNVEGCSVDHFMCPGEVECRSLFQKCDGHQDCPDGFDESTCDEDCGLNFRCENDTACIKAAAKCDGVYDCVNGTDEFGCSPTECGPQLVQCLDKSACIKPLNICDGYYNCHDKSDERDCVDRSTCMSTGRFYCSDGLCLPQGLQCDGSKDCSKGEDEENCTCPENWFQCSDGKCIESIYRCDGQQNCTDGSDEMECLRVDANNVVEVYNSATNSWTVMCEDSWTFEDGNDLCQELGFSSAETVSYIYIFNNGSSWSTIRNSTDQRNSTFWVGKTHFTNNCSSSRAATVTCTNYECGEFKGQNRFLEQWPLMVMIHSFGFQKSCRADILTPLWLITSAECIQKMPQNASEWYVQVEQIDLIASEIVTNSTQIREIKLTVMHPHSSKFRSPILHDFDMALVRLKESLDFKNLAAICLPEAEVKPGITCFTGSMTVNKLQGTATQQPPISFLALTVQARDSCNNPEHYNGWVTSRMLCTESSDTNKKLCNNDEAAPLTCYSINRKWYLAGILTYQRNCGTYYQQPAIYANIFAMRKYIEKVIGMNQYNLTYDELAYVIQDETTLLPNTTEQPEQNVTIPMYWPDVTLFNETENSTYIPDPELSANNSLLETNSEGLDNEMNLNGTLLFQSFKDDENETSIDELIDRTNATWGLNDTTEQDIGTDTDGGNNSLAFREENLWNANQTYPPIPAPLQLSMNENGTEDIIENKAELNENQDVLGNFTESIMSDQLLTTSASVESANFLRNNVKNISLSNDVENNIQRIGNENEKQENNNGTLNHTLEHVVGPEVIYNSAEKANAKEETIKNGPEGRILEEMLENVTSMLTGISGDSFHSLRNVSTLPTFENGSASAYNLNETKAQLAGQTINSESEDSSEENTFHCMEVPQIVDITYICNGIYNCEDESDEWNCVQINSTNNIVEVRHYTGKWFPICSVNWDERLGHKICKQLGYRSSTYTSSTRYVDTNSSSFFQLFKNNTNDLLQGNLKFSSSCEEMKAVSISCSEISCGLWSIKDEDHHFPMLSNSHEPERQWPSVAFLTNGNATCTASILSPNWVITAYSCLIGQYSTINESEWNLVTFNTRKMEELEKKEILVASVITQDAEIVLVKLASRLSLGHHAICLPDQEVVPNDLCVAATWKQYQTNESSEAPEYEQLMILPPEQCNRTDSNFGKLICTGPVNHEESTFQASLGAPLMCMSDNRWQLNGILTSTENQQSTKQTLTYSNIFTLSRWIYSVIEMENASPEIV